MSSDGSSTDPHDKRTPAQFNDAIRTWANVVSAIGAVATVGALIFALIQYDNARDRWRKDVSINLILKGEWEQPYALRHCIRAANTISDEKLEMVYNRKKVVNLSQTEVEAIDQCFADFRDSELEEIYEYEGDSKGNRTVRSLKIRDAALLAQRVNHYLNYDDSVARFMNNHIVDGDIILEYYKRERLCREDYLQLREKIRKMELKFDKIDVQDPVLELSKDINCPKVGPASTQDHRSASL